MSFDVADSAAPVYLLCGNPAYAKSIVQQLSMFGLSCTAFSRSSGLLAAIHGEPPLAVLLDETGCEDASLLQVRP